MSKASLHIKMQSENGLYSPSFFQYILNAINQLSSLNYTKYPSVIFKCWLLKYRTIIHNLSCLHK